VSGLKLNVYIAIIYHHSFGKVTDTTEGRGCFKKIILTSKTTAARFFVELKVST
jgi:hypothetical protein